MSVKKISMRLSRILKIPSVVRFEQPLLDFLEDYCVKRYSKYEVKQTDRLLIIKRKNTVSKKILSAHIDRQGFVVNEEGNLEYASFNARNYYGDKISSDEYVFKKAVSRYIGEEVFAYDPVTGDELSSGKIIGGRYDFKNKQVIYFTKGFPLLAEGTPIALRSKLIMQKNYLYSQIDNAISIAVILQLMEDGFDGTIIFTTEEEIGFSWKHLRDYFEENKIITKELIVLDTTPFKYVHAMDRGQILLRNRDETGIFNKELVEQVAVICQDNNIPYAFKDELVREQNIYRKENNLEKKSYGHTELGRLVENTDGKINGITIQIPSVNYHTNQEMTSFESLSNYYLLLKELLL